jgi:glutamate synthase domain-containing protein 3
VLSPQATPTQVAEGTAAKAAATAGAGYHQHHRGHAGHSHGTGLMDYPIPGSRENVIAGNTCLYGATGGRFFAAGRAGQRFAVRNSGAVAVVEGAGDHACEYMTNGTVVILGSTGRNFGAGMSGGEAFVLDLEDTLLDRYNGGMIEPSRVAAGSEEEGRLRSLVAEHVAETGSGWGRHVLAHWDEARDYFWRVLPNATPANKSSQALVHVPNWSVRRRAVAATAEAAAAATAAAVGLRLAGEAPTAPARMAAVGGSAARFSTAAGLGAPIAPPSNHA